MIVRGFKSVIWVGAVGGAALGCYMVSLQVATERAELTRVEAQIISAKRDIRALQTELGTRGRMSQLETWNAEVMALSTPTASQFLPNELTLARFDQPEPTIDQRGAEVRMAAIETPRTAPAAAMPVVRAVAAAPAARPLITRASYTPGDPRQSLPAAEAVSARPATKRAEPAVKAEPKRDAAAAKTAKAEIKPAKVEAKPAKASAAKPAVAAEAKPASTRSAASTKSATTSKPAAKMPDAKAAAAVPAEKARTTRIDPKLAASLKAPARRGEGGGAN
ncbi:MAG TPA: hypothetical protein VEZ70_13495 [Allosphingosinicella sp.]|nr:hypothetical protein [Allosphingosinicella sp.]